LASSDANYEVVFTEGSTTFNIVYGVFGSANATVGAIGVQKNSTAGNFTQSQCNLRAPAASKQTYTLGCLQPTATATNTSTRTSTPTSTNTPAVTNTPGICGTVTAYTFTTSTGTIVPGTLDTGNHCDDCTTNVAL